MQIVDPKYRNTELPGIPSYGFVPYSDEKQAADADDAAAMSGLASSEVMPDGGDNWSGRCANLASLFRSVSSQGDAAWFVNSEMLGHPSPELAARMIGYVNAIGKSIKTQQAQAFNAAIKAFNDDNGYEMLESYLDVAVRGRPPVLESQWAYILWSQGKNELLHIGSTIADPRSTAKELNVRGSSTYPYGVMAAWLVNDVASTAVDLEAALLPFKMSAGQYFIKLGDAKGLIERVLKDNGNFVLSPWHADSDQTRNLKNIFDTNG